MPTTIDENINGTINKNDNGTVSENAKDNNISINIIKSISNDIPKSFYQLIYQRDASQHSKIT